VTAAGRHGRIIRTVPGEGVEPSRAEAHRFLRPARLPVPPSRPGRPRVARSGRAALAGLLLLVAAACGEDVSPSGTTGPTIAFLFDGSPSDAELVTSPALAGLELAAHEAGGFEIEPVNVGLDHEEVTASLRDLGEDRGVVAAVVAPWTAPPGGAIDLLAAEGVPIVTLSWAWGPPREGDGLWLSFVAPRAREAVILLSAANVAPEGEPLCLAGDEHVTSRALLATATPLGEAAGDPQVLTVGIAESGKAASADAVADRIRDSGCPVLVWVGGAEAAGSVLSSIHSLTAVVAASRTKTDEGLALASSETAIFTVCACVDVSLSTEPRLQRFVHDLQAESGASPGAFAVEAYDAGTLLIGFLGGDGATRGRVAEEMDDLTRFEGLAERYAFEPDGSRRAGSIRAGRWRAAGSRWLPEAAPVGASG
jgi:substrate-binding family protein